MAEKIQLDVSEVSMAISSKFSDMIAKMALEIKFLEKQVVQLTENEALLVNHIQKLEVEIDDLKAAKTEKALPFLAEKPTIPINELDGSIK